MENIEKRRARQRKYQANWYAKNKKEQINKVAKRQAKLKDWVITYKSKLKCLQCGEDHISCLDFHHRNPKEKDAIISSIWAKGWSIKKIKTEIDKCDILCSNCHRKLHHKTASE